jgi:hypothetical protein
MLFQTGVATATPTTLPSDPAALIRQLAGPDLATRDAAQAMLLEADPGVIELLREAREQTRDPDVQLRLDSLMVRFADAEAIGASRITLKFENAPLKDVLDELGRQAKTQFSDPSPDFGNQPPRITIDVSNVTFWQALQELRRVANLSITPQPDIWRVGKNFANPIFGPNAFEAGAFLVQPLMANYSRTISYSPNGNNSGENFSITFQMISEPKIRLAQSAGQFRLIKAIDSNGNNLIGAQPVQTFGIGQNLFHIAAQLTYPANPGARITELVGSVKLNIARRVEALTIEDFTPASKEVQRTVEGAAITISPGESNPGQPNWVFVNVLLEPQGDAALLNRLQTTLRQMRLTDASGRALQMNQFQANSVTPQRAEYRISYMPLNNLAGSGPYKLVFEIPTSFREVEVPITVRDLKMP